MAAAHEFAVEVDSGSDPIHVRVRGELDMSNAPALTAALTQAGTGGGTVVADLSGVTFLDSSALGALVASARALAADGGRMEIGARSAVVERVLEITGLASGTDELDVRPLGSGGPGDG